MWQKETDSSRYKASGWLLAGLKGGLSVLWISYLVSGMVYAHEGTAHHIEQLNKLIEKAPEAQSLYIERGAIYSREGGLHEKALADFEKAETLGPKIAVAYELGLLFFRTEQFTKAQAYFDQYITAFPNSPQGYEYRAKTAYHLNDLQQSFRDFEKFFALQKKVNPGSYIEAASIYVSSEQKGLDAAIELIDQGIERIGLNPQLQRYAVELELQRNQVESAIKRFQSLQSLLNDSPVWKVGMAELFLKAGRNNEAKKLLTTAKAQLTKLKPTPARLQLLETVSQLSSR